MKTSTLVSIGDTPSDVTVISADSTEAMSQTSPISTDSITFDASPEIVTSTEVTSISETMSASESVTSESYTTNEVTNKAVTSSFTKLVSSRDGAYSSQTIHTPLLETQSSVSAETTVSSTTQSNEVNTDISKAFDTASTSRDAATVQSSTNKKVSDVSDFSPRMQSESIAYTSEYITTATVNDTSNFDHLIPGQEQISNASLSLAQEQQLQASQCKY